MRHVVVILSMLLTLVLAVLGGLWVVEYINYCEAWAMDEASIPLTYDEFRKYYEPESGDWYLDETFALYKNNIVIMKSYSSFHKYRKFYFRTMKSGENKQRERAVMWFYEQFDE